MTFSSFTFYMDEPYDCGCHYDCNCPSRSHSIMVLYNIEDAADHFAHKIKSSRGECVKRLIVNGLGISEYGNLNPIVKHRNTVTYVNPITIGAWDRHFDPELLYDGKVPDGMLAEALQALYDMYELIKPKVAVYVDTMDKKLKSDIQRLDDAQKARDLAEYERLKKLFSDK